MKLSKKDKEDINSKRNEEYNKLLSQFIQIDNFLNNFLDTLATKTGLNAIDIDTFKQRLKSRQQLFINQMKLGIPRVVRSSYNLGRIVATKKIMQMLGKFPKDPEEQLKLIQEIKANVVGKDLTRQQISSLANIEDNLNKSVNKVSTSIGRRHNDLLRKIQLETLSDMVKIGATQEEVAEEFKKRLEAAGLKNSGKGFQWVDVGGQKKRIASYADMVSRTALSEAFNQGQKDQFKEDGIDLVIWEGSDNACEECNAMIGQIFSISGTNKNYPILTTQPPLHPNCGCQLNPYKA